MLPQSARYEDTMRTLGVVCAHCWPVTGRRVHWGRSQHYCGGLHCGLPLVAFWQHNANAKCLRVHAGTRSMPIVLYVSIISTLCRRYFSVGNFKYFTLSVYDKCLHSCTNLLALFSTFSISSIKYCL